MTVLVTKSGVLPNRLNHRPTAQNRASTKFALNVVARASVIGLGVVALADVIRVTVRANFVQVARTVARNTGATNL